MRYVFSLSVGILSFLFLSGCASTQLEAPCNQHATFCGTKTKINSW